METALKERLAGVDELFENNEFMQAANILEELAQTYPTEGMIPYYLGKLCIISSQQPLALRYMLKAEELGYRSADMYMVIGNLQRIMGTASEAENAYVQALALCQTGEETMQCRELLAALYLESDMLLKADKIAKKIIAEYPSEYAGYHFHIAVEVKRKRFDDAFVYMEKLPEQLKTHPQYLSDVIGLYKLSGKVEELSALLDEDTRFEELIPQIVLREKIALTPDPLDEEDTKKEQLIRELASKYFDRDAMLALMILEFGRQNFKKSARIAQFILLTSNKQLDFVYFTAAYYQMFNVFFLADQKPSVEMVEWMKETAEYCKVYAESTKDVEYLQAVEDSVQTLFDAIQKNSN